MSGFTMPEGAGEKLWNNVFVPGFQSAGRIVYDNSVPIVKEYFAGTVQQGTKRGLSYIDSLFSPKKGMSRRSTPAFDNQGYSPAPEFQHWTQSSRATTASTMSQSVNGQNSSVSPSDGVVVPAMFNPGRGAELGLVNKLIDTPLKFKTGEPAGPPRPVDPIGSSLQLYKPLRFNQAFAWKAIVPKQSFTSGELVNRGYVHNIFRHYNYATWGTGATDLYGPANAAGGWNKTLGPDGAQTRIPPRVSIADNAALTAAGFSTGLISPYRNPSWGERMYSRVSQQFLENMCWAAHPYKYIQPQIGTSGTIDSEAPTVYKNAGSSYELYPRSMPAQQPSTPSTASSSPYYYRTQMGRGKVSYDFSNDGSGPIVVDVVITKLKQGKIWDSVGIGSTSGSGTMLDDVYQNGYLRMAQANRNLGGTNGLNGQPALGTDCFTNARVQFMPKAALKYAQNQPTGQVTNQLDQPFKQVARDQFVISAGATRAWSFELPALDYDPRRYGNLTSSSSSADRVVISDICSDMTYIVSIAFSSVSVPLTENPVVGSVTNGAVVDRRPADCNLSVTGSYEETCYPVYLGKDTLSTTYINGALDVPFYQTTAPSTMRSIEIANLNQVTRDSTPGSAYISVGALNTISGA